MLETVNNTASNSFTWQLNVLLKQPNSQKKWFDWSDTFDTFRKLSWSSFVRRWWWWIDVIASFQLKKRNNRWKFEGKRSSTSKVISFFQFVQLLKIRSGKQDQIRCCGRGKNFSMRFSKSTVSNWYPTSITMLTLNDLLYFYKHFFIM